MKRVGWAVLLACIAASSIGCTVQLNRRPAARLRVIADPEAARVYVDERFIGSAKVLAVRPRELPEGEHRLTVEAPDHFPHDMMIEMPPGTTTVRIVLREVPE